MSVSGAELNQIDIENSEKKQMPKTAVNFFRAEPEI